MDSNFSENNANMLKHILCGALTHLDAIGIEIKKLDLKEDPSQNDPDKMKRAQILHLTMLAINDIIHPAHTVLKGLFQGNDTYFDALIASFAKAKSDGLAFKGCQCADCVGTTKDSSDIKS